MAVALNESQREAVERANGFCKSVLRESGRLEAEAKSKIMGMTIDPQTGEMGLIGGEAAQAVMADGMLDLVMEAWPNAEQLALDSIAFDELLASNAGDVAGEASNG